MTRTPSTLSGLLAECDAHGIRLALADGGGLEIDAPQDSLTTDLLSRLKAHKADLMRLLRRNDDKERRPRFLNGRCPHDAGTVMRPTVQGDRPFCPLCGRRIGFDAPYPWA